MNATELFQKAQFVVDADGKKQSVLIDYAAWETVLTLLADLQDAEEIRQLRNAGEEVISWERAKAELRTKGVDV